MPIVIALGSLLVSGLFAASTVLDKADDLTDSSSSTSQTISMAGIAMVAIAGYLIYKKVK